MKYTPDTTLTDKDSTTMLNDTILFLIQDYTDNTLRQRLNEIYGASKEKNIIQMFRYLPTIEHTKFADFTNKALGTTSDLSQYLIYLNSLFQCDDVDTLKSSWLYKDVLNGKICKKPTNVQETHALIHQIRAILQKNYNTIIDEWEVEQSQILGNDTTTDTFE